MKTLLLYFFIFVSTSILSQSILLKTKKLDICDGYDNVLFFNDTCDIVISIKNDTVVLKNSKTNHSSFYVFSELIEIGDDFSSWKCEDPKKTGVILFYLKENQFNNYIFYIFFENQTYRYYCEKE